MFCRKLNLFFFVFLYFEISLLSADEVSNTSSNQGDSRTSVQPRFFDLGNMGLPNFGSGRFGNPTSNYPVNSFSPFGNQNNMGSQPQPQPISGVHNQYPNQGNTRRYYPNQQRYPYQGDSMNPSPNYNPQYKPNQGGYPGHLSYPYGGNGWSQDPNFNYRPQPYNPTDITYPGSVNSGMQPNQGTNYNPSIPGRGNQGNTLRPGQTFSNFLPDDINDFQNPNIQFPDSPYGTQPNLYFSQPNSGANGPNYGVEQPAYLQPNPVNNIPDSNIQFPTEASQVNEGQPIQNPDNINSVPMNPMNPGAPPNVPNNPVNTGDDGKAAILGKPVIVTPTTISPSQVVFDYSSENPTQKKCVQDCPSTSEYNPVCGSNNVTYINPGKFICARNCGEGVYLRNKGRCASDVQTN